MCTLACWPSINAQASPPAVDGQPATGQRSTSLTLSLGALAWTTAELAWEQRIADGFSGVLIVGGGANPNFGDPEMDRSLLEIGALRVLNPALDLPRLELVFELLDDDQCADHGSNEHAPTPSWAQSDAGDAAACAPRRTGYRHGVLGPKLKTSAAGAVEAAGITIFHFDYGGGGGDRLMLSVRDPCERVGFAQRQVGG